MINNNIILCYDLETSHYNPYRCDLWEIGAVPIDPRTLEIKYDEAFSSLSKPPGITDWPRYAERTQKARDVNKISIEALQEAPAEEQVFKKFVHFVKKYTKGHITKAPVAAGFNIINFDNIIMNRLCWKYKVVDKEGSPTLFMPRDKIDLIDLMFNWFESYGDGPNKYSMKFLRPYFGISEERAHRATKDVEDTAALIVRFLKFQRQLSSKYAHQFKGSFANAKLD